MTTIISDLVRDALSSSPFSHWITRVDVLVVLVLVALLAEREVLRAGSPLATDRFLPPVGVLIDPLLLVLVIVLVARTVSLVT